MNTTTLDSIQKNLANSQKNNSFIEDSFENSNIESLFPSDEKLPHCTITFFTQKIYCG